MLSLCLEIFLFADSEHEGEGGVAEAVTDIEATENGCVAPMICEVAGPELAAQHDEAASAVTLN